jgi:hypothetical protein
VNRNFGANQCLNLGYALTCMLPFGRVGLSFEVEQCRWLNALCAYRMNNRKFAVHLSGRLFGSPNDSIGIGPHAHRAQPLPVLQRPRSYPFGVPAG